MTTDVAVRKTSLGYYDISFTTSGDIETIQALDTAILCSLLMEQRALISEVPVVSRRRGWIGNESTPGFEMGSKLWLFEQSRITGGILSDIEVIARNSLQWMIDDNIAVDAGASARLTNDGVSVTVTLERSSSEVERKLFELWNNTGSTL